MVTTPVLNQKFQLGISYKYYSFFFLGKRVRLGGGSRSNEGYVEALASNGQWGGVCDDYWDRDDANVVCQMLGYPSAEAWWRGPHNFGNNPSGDKFVLDNLKCAGSELSIFDCSHQPEWNENCWSVEIVGVRCALG